MEQVSGKSAALIKAESRTRVAGIAGCFLAVITILQFFFPYIGGLSPAVVASGLLYAMTDSGGQPDISILGIPPFMFFTLLFFAIVVAMTFGIFKKKKVCSAILFSYTLVAFVFSLSTATSIAAITSGVTLAILIFLFYGMLGTFDYHQHIPQAAGQGRNAPPT